MCFLNFWKKAVPFALTLSAGVFAGTLMSPKAVHEQQFERPHVEAVETHRGRGCSTHGKKNFSMFESKNQTSDAARTSPLKIVSTPRAAYTDEARRNQTEGKVVLKVTFLPTGEIGAVEPVNNLPDGLTEQAVAAAGRIKFEPARKNGLAISVIKTIEYEFTISKF